MNIAQICRGIIGKWWNVSADINPAVLLAEALTTSHGWQAKNAESKIISKSFS